MPRASLIIASGICAVSRSDGKLDVIWPRDDIANSVAIEKVADAVGTGFSGAAFASVLIKDGTVIDCSGGKASQAGTGDLIAKVHGFRLGETKQGELTGWSSGVKPMLKDVDDNPRQVFSENNTFAAIGEEGAFFPYRKEDNGPWTEVREVKEALANANSFAWFQGGWQEWLVVVLPADSVSRSGVWTLDALAADRKTR